VKWNDLGYERKKFIRVFSAIDRNFYVRLGRAGLRRINLAEFYLKSCSYCTENTPLPHYQLTFFTETRISSSENHKEHINTPRRKNREDSNVKAGCTDSNHKRRKQSLIREEGNWRPLYLRRNFINSLLRTLSTVNISSKKQSSNSSLSNLLTHPYSEASNSLPCQLHEDLFVHRVST
jgi:hypothetical protein